MNRTHDLLKKAVTNGQISEKEALKIGNDTDLLLQRSVDMLNELKVHFGMFTGGRIETLIGEITYQRPRDQVYFHDKEPDGQ